MEVTYENIKSLIKKEVVTGNQIQLEFCAKNQEIPTQTVAVVMIDQKDMKKNATKNAVKSTVKNSIISNLLNLIGIRGFGRSIARSATQNIGKKNKKDFMKTEVTKKTKEEAIVKAFKGIMSIYKYNEQNSEWEYITPVNPQ